MLSSSVIIMRVNCASIYILGIETDIEEMMPFTIINKWNECATGDNCVDIPTLAIQEHDQEAKKDYIFTVKAINGAGSFSLIPSDPFQVKKFAEVFIGRYKT